MILYLDTNIILSYYDNQDPFQSQNKRIIEQRTLTCVTGFITIIEFESVIGRLWRNNQIQLNLNIEHQIQTFPLPIQIIIITETCFNRLPITILPVSSLEQFQFKGALHILENTFSLAYRLGPQIQLRTLDTLQISSAVKIKQYTNYDVEYFLTNDRNILKNKALIRTKTAIIPISSDELIMILKI
ncbi:MAG: hypothetical protein ACTSRS_11300 [Candidatus Helarchaeota archaeon]